MRIFETFNHIGEPCPVCKTKAPQPTVLVPIPGTEDDGIVECKQVHHRCYETVKAMMDAAPPAPRLEGEP